MIEEKSAYPPEDPKLIPAPVEGTGESIQVTTETDDELVRIPRKQYEELVNANDNIYISLLNAYDKFDDIIGNIMNLNTIVFNKKKELKILVDELNKQQQLDQQQQKQNKSQ